MSDYTFNCACHSNNRYIKLPTLTMMCPYDFAYISNFIMLDLSSFDPYISGAFSVDSSPSIHLNHIDYEVTQLALKESIKKLYANGNKPMKIHVEIKKYGSVSNLTFESSGFYTKDISFFDKILKNRLLNRELNMRLCLIDESLFKSYLKVTIEGFKDLEKMRDIFEEELDVIKSTINHNKDYKWTVITTFQSMDINNPFLVFPEIYTLYSNNIFTIMSYLQDRYIRKNFEVHISIDQMSNIYVDVITKDDCSIAYCKMAYDTIMEMLSRDLYSQNVIPNNIKEFESMHGVKCKEPITIRARVDSLLWLRLDTVFADSSKINLVMIKIKEWMKSIGLDIEMTHDKKAGVCCKIDKCGFPKFERLEEEILNMVEKFNKEDSCDTKEINEVTIYPTYVSWIKNTHPDYPPEKCAIKVPCKYDTDEEDALISFIHNEFPSSEIMDTNRDKMFSGMSGNYTFSVVDNEFCLSIAIKGAYMVSHQLLKESFEKHIQNYITLYKMKKMMIAECSKVKYTFGVDDLTDKVARAAVVYRDGQYHVFMDFQALDSTKKFLKEACEIIRKTTKKEVFEHEVPLFIIEDINEHNKIKTETIDVYINGENKE